ncbi:probable purine permease 5 [Benincasa hispida]|uniref:probable purine permease 5 n=1 Tax=Benincasa hispida TaxID=102211 RepID=UPI001900697A|nr:probable purine permease 5 [Benincasa hispida]
MSYDDSYISMDEMENTPQESGNQISSIKQMALEAFRTKQISHWILLALSSVAMLVGFPASSLLSRVYYNNGGKSKWIISWAAGLGWLIPALLLVPIYLLFDINPTPLNLMLIISYIVLGFLNSVDSLMYAYAYAYLPASTASLLASSSLVFSVLFGYLLAKNRLNASILNAIVVITAAVVMIGLDSNSDTYGDITNQQYIFGFVWDILGSALHGLMFALSELIFIKLLDRKSFHVVLEQQVMVSFFTFLFSTLGVFLNNDFQNMKSEAASFVGGTSSYLLVLIWSAISCQLAVLGGTAILFLSSTIFAGVLNAVRVPITSIGAVIFLNDPMSGFKILSLVITFWGFSSYIYGSSYVSKSS